MSVDLGQIQRLAEGDRAIVAIGLKCFKNKMAEETALLQSSGKSSPSTDDKQDRGQGGGEAGRLAASDNHVHRGTDKENGPRPVAQYGRKKKGKGKRKAATPAPGLSNNAQPAPQEGWETFPVPVDKCNGEQDVEPMMVDEEPSEARIDCATTCSQNVTYDLNDPTLPVEIREMVQPLVHNTYLRMSKEAVELGLPLPESKEINRVAMNEMKGLRLEDFQRMRNSPVGVVVPLEQESQVAAQSKGNSVQVCEPTPAFSNTNNNQIGSTTASNRHQAGSKVRRPLKQRQGQSNRQMEIEVQTSTEETARNVAKAVVMDKERMNAFRQRLTVQKFVCNVADCNKPASISCGACGLLVACTEKHRKKNTKDHETRCFPVRLAEKIGTGKIVIANRDFANGRVIFTDSPLIILPLNPHLHFSGSIISSTSRTYPKGYCVQCCKYFNNPDGVGLVDSVKLCPMGCLLPICDGCISTPDDEKLGYNFHEKAECKVLAAAYQSKAIHPKFVVDQSVVMLLRLFSNIQCAENQKEYLLREKLDKMLGGMRPPPLTNFAKFKIDLLRKCSIENNQEGNDESLRNHDWAIQRFGRNSGPGFSAATDETTYHSSTYTKCIYPTASLVLHSCLPNCAFIFTDISSVGVKTQYDIKKGETLTVSYDDKCLFYPTWKRRRHLLEEFGFSCKCRRCTTSSELDTHFSSFPCFNSNCSGGGRNKTAHYMVPEDPLNCTSNWVCTACKKQPISYLRLESYVCQLEAELENASNDAFALFDAMKSMVDGKYLHWNNYLIFDYSVKLFNTLWNQFNSGDEKAMSQYSLERGLQFLPAAESLLTITHKFLPFGYLRDFVLPMRLAAVIKMRNMANKIEAEEIKISKVDQVVRDIYFRQPQGNPLHLMKIGESEDKLQVLEMNVMGAVKKSLFPTFGDDVEKISRGAPLLAKIITPHEPGLADVNGEYFPWALKV